MSILLLLVLAAFQPSSPTFQAVERGANCLRASDPPGGTECHYQVGRDLYFVIAGVGETDAGVTVLRTRGYEGDYYSTFGIGHGCVIIKPGTAKSSTLEAALDMAFVSPKTGRIYRTWPDCAEGRGGVMPKRGT